jgi:transposase InsO family protein
VEEVKFAAITGQEKVHPIAGVCRVLGVSCGGDQTWRNREPSGRTFDDRRLGACMKAALEENRVVYRSRRIHRELREAGAKVGTHRIAPGMQGQRVRACCHERVQKTTYSKRNGSIASNLVERHFRPKGRDGVRATEFTYIRTWSGWTYRAVVLEVNLRRMVGVAVSNHRRTDLAVAALQRDLRTRQARQGLIQHSEQGVPYASAEYRASLKRHGIIVRMSGKGYCWDNAVEESFFATLKEELFY